MTPAELAAHYRKPQYDPVAEYAAYQAHPENYCTLSEILRELQATHDMKDSRTMAELKRRFDHWKAILKDKDPELLRTVTALKDEMKAKLTALEAAGGT